MSLRSGLAIAIASLCAILLFWPTLGSWFDGDEVGQLVRLHKSEGLSAELSIWRFDVGQNKMEFFRPLASATVLVDRALFGVDARGYHGQNLLWYMLLCFTIYHLLRSLRGDELGAIPGFALTAAIIFAIDATHAEVVARFACRHFTMATVFGIAGLHCHIRWSRSGDGRQLFFSLLAMTAALLSSEAALQVIAYVVAFELMRSDENLRRRAQKLLPATLLVAVYGAFYGISGYGAHGNGYLDPFADPAAVVATMPARFARLWTEALLCPPSIVGWYQTPYRLVGTPGTSGWNSEMAIATQLALFVGATSLFALLVSNVPRRLRWLALGTVLSLIPATIGQPGPRLVFVPSIGVAALIACFLHAVRTSDQRWQHRRLVTIVALLLASQRLAASPVMLHAQLSTQRDLTMQVRLKVDPEFRRSSEDEPAAALR